MAAIDIHTHAFPDAIAPRAMATLEAAGDWAACGPGTVDGLIESMDRADVDISVLCPIATKAEQVEGIFKWCKQVDSDRIDPFPSIHPDTPKVGTFCKKVVNAGMYGIKMHPQYQKFEADDPRVDEVYQAISDAGLLLTMHCGWDLAYPGDDKAAPHRFAAVLDRFPDLKLICTHFGGWKAWDEVEELLLGRDIWIETSFSMMFMEPGQALRMIRKHGADKCLFGSDWPWTDQKKEIQAIRDLGLTDEEVEKILCTNALRLLGY